MSEYTQELHNKYNQIHKEIVNLTNLDPIKKQGNYIILMRKLNNLEEIDPARSSFIKELRKELKQKYNQSKRRKSINWEEGEKEYTRKELVKLGMKGKKAANQAIRDFSRPFPPSFSLETRYLGRYLGMKGPIYGNIDRWDRRRPDPRNKNGGHQKSTKRRRSRRKRRRKSRRKSRRKRRRRRKN